MTAQSQSDKLKIVIQRIVLEELEAILPDVLAQINIAVNEQVMNLVTEAIATRVDAPTAQSVTRPPVNRAKLQEMIGATFSGDTLRATTGNLRHPAPVVEETANGADINNLIFKDYSGLMKKLNEIRPDSPTHKPL